MATTWLAGPSACLREAQMAYNCLSNGRVGRGEQAVGGCSVHSSYWRFRRDVIRGFRTEGFFAYYHGHCCPVRGGWFSSQEFAWWVLYAGVASGTTTREWANMMWVRRGACRELCPAASCFSQPPLSARQVWHAHGRLSCYFTHVDGKSSPARLE